MLTELRNTIDRKAEQGNYGNEPIKIRQLNCQDKKQSRNNE